MENRRALLKKIRDKEDEICFLRDALYVALGGSFSEPEHEREGEEVSKQPVDDLVGVILKDVLN